MRSGWQSVSTQKIAGDLPIITTRGISSGKRSTTSGVESAMSSPPGSMISQAAATALARAQSMRNYGNG